HEAAARADEDRQMLDADRTLVLARAARRALPQNLFRVDLAKLRFVLPLKQRVLRLQHDRLRIQRLPRAPSRAVDLAAAALDARERVQPHLAAEIFHRLEAEPFLLEAAIRQ